MYPPGDPRSALQQEDSSPAAAARPPQFFEFSRLTPTDMTGRGSHTWLVRTENLLVAYTEGRKGDEFDCSSAQDEVILVLPDESARATLPGTTPLPLPGGSVAVLSAGANGVRLDSDGRLLRVFAARSTRLSERALNRDDYRMADGRIPAFRPWAPVAQERVPQVIRLAEIPLTPERFGRIFRSDAAMINIFLPSDGPRDPSALSPHSHQDFDQLSLQLSGDYVHHVRTEWGPDSTAWRDDLHRACSSPAAAIFPPPLIHTSQAIGDGSHQLIDIFGPPRADFAAQPGWLLNAEDRR